MRYTLPLKTGFVRSKELRGTILIEPARAEPGESGVGDIETSIRETLLRLKKPTSTERPVPGGLERLGPPSGTGVFSAGAPSMETNRASPPLKSTVRPGR